MAPLPGSAADDEWWKRRLGALNDRAAALAAEALKQQADLARLRSSSAENEALSEDLEAQARADIHAERAAEQMLQTEQSAMTIACQQTKELDAERRKLLSAISDMNLRLGEKALATSKVADMEEEVIGANRGATSRAKVLRKSLQSLGDKQATLAAEEEAERSKRRQLREGVRVRLHRHASDRAALERRLAGRNAEIEKWQHRLEAAQTAEKHAIEEAQRLREQAQRCESLLGPQKDREREEIRRQLRETAAMDDHLRDELREAKERLWRKEQREREIGGRPWAHFIEAAL